MWATSHVQHMCIPFALQENTTFHEQDQRHSKCAIDRVPWWHQLYWRGRLHDGEQGWWYDSPFHCFQSGLQHWFSAPKLIEWLLPAKSNILEHGLCVFDGWRGREEALDREGIQAWTHSSLLQLSFGEPACGKCPNVALPLLQRTSVRGEAWSKQYFSLKSQARVDPAERAGLLR